MALDFVHQYILLAAYIAAKDATILSRGILWQVVTPQRMSC